MWVIWTVIGCTISLCTLMWVSGIEYMKENHPEYKGEDLFNEDEKQ